MLSPGEIDLLRLIRQRGAMRLKEIRRSRLFHGWDPETFGMIVQRLLGVGLLQLDGEILAVPSESGARVAGKFLVETDDQRR